MIVLQGDFLDVFYVRYSTLLYLPPLRFHCVGGCGDRTQDCCDFGDRQRRIGNKEKRLKIGKEDGRQRNRDVRLRTEDRIQGTENVRQET
jgi:hypothetical protein